MIKEFLRLFVTFTALESRYAESETARVHCEDRERLWRSRCEEAERLRDEALKEKERNHKMICNWMALYYGSPNVPYPDEFVHVRREEPEREPVVHKRHASELAREMDREFREQFGKQAEREFDSFNP